MKNINVTIFEDNKHLRESLYYMINGSPGFTCTGAYPDCENILMNIKKSIPDVVLMDIEMPGINGIEGVKLIKQHYPDIQVLMQTVFHNDEFIFKAICAGASGYILKTTTPSGYMDALQEVYNGGSPMTAGIARRVLELFKNNIQIIEQNDYQLTSKEKEILQEMVQGKSYKMIADSLSIAPGTVHAHLKNIYAKLHVNSNTEAVSKVLREKLI